MHSRACRLLRKEPSRDNSRSSHRRPREPGRLHKDPTRLIRAEASSGRLGWCTGQGTRFPARHANVEILGDGCTRLHDSLPSHWLELGPIPTWVSCLPQNRGHIELDAPWGDVSLSIVRTDAPEAYPAV